ncbi:hypothetical protein [Marimonas arenosa]|uniref:DUF4177 domain-containing protein n=1 Tax=Marimonas arenosa TaxID=1795305 RepID=A0AAE4B7I6_9RHOB|nr:hypothetical protein [Marimonas arenosa]MDQ2091551.1 DUF4177 domain-containing protein [Marimonas arenosa]
MTQYEYKVVPAPRKGLKSKGVRSAEARFAYAIQTLMNDMAGAGWEFLRAETLASEERHGLASAQTVYRDLLVFRRPRAHPEAAVNLAVTESVTPDDDPAPSDTADRPAPDTDTPSEAEAAAGDETRAWSEGEPAPEPEEATAFETSRRD